MNNKDLEKELLNLVCKPINPKLQITKKSTPIPFFGNYKKAKVYTISLNPSDREFYDKKNNLLIGEKKRLCSREVFGKKDEDSLSENEGFQVLEACEKYFDNNPYRSWFDKFNRFLLSFDSSYSYYEGTVVALDLVQWATTAKWSALQEDIKNKLLESSLPYLKKLFARRNIDKIFLNGKTVYSVIKKELNCNFIEKSIKIKEKNIKVYLGRFNNIDVIGWNIYLQSQIGLSSNDIINIGSLIRAEYDKWHNKS
ncbi:hypothetical protein E4O00_02790 [Treponema sp. OMZ 788]|uniref:hypothetical protein n=1 Tax=Treponema sp. OMZ 788 TaxID=2563664 RepID=UPI0020A5E091|nr:hypothetical protein [Treponema sp. OMZ 788]UTC65117.1 hypothetical protein E4O00_02790 [Treponema sp. OMZ 788]